MVSQQPASLDVQRRIDAVQDQATVVAAVANARQPSDLHRVATLECLASACSQVISTFVVDGPDRVVDPTPLRTKMEYRSLCTHDWFTLAGILSSKTVVWHVKGCHRYAKW